MEQAWMIAGPQCGRDKKGTFRCVCGRCRALPPKERQNGRYSSNHSGQRGNDANDRV